MTIIKIWIIGNTILFELTEVKHGPGRKTDRIIYLK